MSTELLSLSKSQVQSARALQARPPFVLAKGGKTAFTGTCADVAVPHRSPALLGRRGTAPKLAALRQGRLYGPADLRCSAPFTARKINCRSQSQDQGESESDGLRKWRAVVTAELEYPVRSKLVCARGWPSQRNQQLQLLSLLRLQLLGVLSIFQSLKASRAPEPDRAEEAPLSERSEFGRRARSGEERRGPAAGRLVSAPTVLATFAKTKVARASARKLLPLHQKSKRAMGETTHA